MEPVGGIPLSNAEGPLSTFIFQTFQVKFDNKGYTKQSIHRHITRARLKATNIIVFTPATTCRIGEHGWICFRNHTCYIFCLFIGDICIRIRNGIKRGFHNGFIT